MQTWGQDALALTLVLASMLYLVRRIWRTAGRAATGSSCGSCNSCAAGSPAVQPLVQIKPLVPTK